MDQSNKREAVILGALLHDIGKFVQRAQNNPKSQDHQHWGTDWFNNNLAEGLNIFNEDEKQTVRSAINNHHQGEKYISLADAISAGMDRIELEQEEEKGSPFTDRLISIFSRISISDKPKKDMYYKLTQLGKNNLEDTFPVEDKKCQPNEYINLLTDFNKEIEALDFAELMPRQVIEQMYFLLWKYTWCIPSAVYKDEPDVSLFDHLKTTAAIAGCLYDYQQENSGETLDIESPAFRLVAGDISGIQSYIFDVISQHGKVAKRLRARSLYVQLLSEIATHRIIHEFNLPLCNVISSAGGNFYILLPNLKNTEEKLKKLQKEFDEWTYKNFKAEVYLTLENITISGKELNKYNELLDTLKSKQQIKKYQPYSSILITNGQWNNNFVLDEVINGDENICSACHKHPVQQDEMCQWCFNDEKIGEVLPKANFIAFFKNEEQGYPVFSYSFQLWESFNQGSSAYLVLALNNPSLVGMGFKYLANHIPTGNDISCTISEHQHEPNRPVFFECIANNSEGDSLIGYVKADVDNMGEILRVGFQRTKPSISRFVSLSRMLETFFAGYLQKRLETDFRDIYTVFSGGDDFFVIGSWNRAIDFVKTMREEFSKFTGYNPDFTFSAGIVLAKPHEPISFCAEFVEDELKKSKDYSGKDSITLFNQTIKWDELDKVLSEANKVINWLNNEPPIVSRGFIYNLRKYGEMAQKSRICEKNKEIVPQYLKFVPLLIYDINRNLTKDAQKEAKDWATKLSPTIQKSKEEDNLPYLRIIMDYVLTYTR